MSDHLKVADYHDAQARKEFDKQGQRLMPQGEYIRSRSVQESHQRTADQARRQHADATGQIVEYTPIGKPVFRKRY